MIREQYLLTKEYKQASIELLFDNLSAMRARVGMTQEELANVIGVSRQTYYSIENGKREMTWPIFLAITFVFSSLKETTDMIKELKIYPIDMFMKFNGYL